MSIFDFNNRTGDLPFAFGLSCLCLWPCARMIFFLQPVIQEWTAFRLTQTYGDRHCGTCCLHLHLKAKLKLQLFKRCLSCSTRLFRVNIAEGITLFIENKSRQQRTFATAHLLVSGSGLFMTWLIKS